MSNINDGGPAFPSANAVQVGDCETGGHPGLTMRDYFAAKAMAGMLAAAENYQTDELAAYAYAVADAMLAARKA